MIALISTPAKPALNLWPHAIIAWFVIFAAALAAWIAFAVRQNMDLVRADSTRRRFTTTDNLTG